VIHPTKTILFAALNLLASMAFATSITFSGGGINGASGNNLSASAQFDLNGSILTVTLTNTATSANNTYVPSDVLMAVYFGTTSLAGLTPQTASLNGSSIVNPDGTDVGSNWEFLGGFSPVRGLVNGISASGLTVFGQGNFNHCAATSTCNNLGGIDWGLVPSFFPPPQGINGGFSGRALVDDRLQFALGTTQGFSLASINSVQFQWGTSDTEFRATGTSAVPEPSTFVLIGGGLGLAAFLRRKKRTGQAV
jgi:hypothetical protein